LAIYNDVLLDIKFPRVIYKKLLGEPCLLEDLQEFDPEMYRTLCFLRDTQDPNLEETIGTSFEIELDNFGAKDLIELKPNGANILISQSNKLEYIDLYLDWKFNKSIEQFFNPFSKGFYKVADKTIFEIIESDDLELIVCGTEDLDFKELEEGSIVTDGFTKDSQTVKDFWEIVHEFDLTLKKKFLFFLSGCDRSPIKGLASLKMIIGKHGPDSDKLPCAHTCFNFLLMPDYQNKEKLKKLLLLAVENSEGFGLI
jgi:ubiquitin-protein ligase E3 A